MTARDELRDFVQSELHRIDGFERWRFDAPVDLADSLLAAGYRKSRTITNAEELDALPFESVVRDAEGHVLERWGEPEERLWTTVMVKDFIPCDEIALPAIVLYGPEA